MEQSQPSLSGGFRGTSAHHSSPDSSQSASASAVSAAPPSNQQSEHHQAISQPPTAPTEPDAGSHRHGETEASGNASAPQTVRILPAMPSAGDSSGDSSGVLAQSPALVVTNQSALRVESSTWHRDSHDLYDYESRHVTKRRFLLARSGKLFRNGADVQCLGENGTYPQVGDYLLSIAMRNGKYVVQPPERNLGGASSQLTAKKLWMIVKERNNNRYALNENDVMKLGRFKLKVKQLVKPGDDIPELKLEDGEPVVSFTTLEERKTMQCRICLLEGGDGDDPLICPCSCKGSIKFVHLECLRHWINGRLNISDEQGNSFFFKQVQCELCKTPFPTAVKHNDEKLNVVKVPNTVPPYIVLENIVGNNQRGIHVMSMAEKKDVKLGRGHESDVRIPDVSISRYHATIRYSEGEFHLEDHNSKFGTLVALRKSYQILRSDDMTLQVGRSVVKLSVEDNVNISGDVTDISDPPTPPLVSAAEDGAGRFPSVGIAGGTPSAVAGVAGTVSGTAGDGGTANALSSASGAVGWSVPSQSHSQLHGTGVSPASSAASEAHQLVRMMMGESGVGGPTVSHATPIQRPSSSLSAMSVDASSPPAPTLPANYPTLSASVMNARPNVAAPRSFSAGGAVEGCEGQAANSSADSGASAAATAALIRSAASQFFSPENSSELLCAFAASGGVGPAELLAAAAAGGQSSNPTSARTGGNVPQSTGVPSDGSASRTPGRTENAATTLNLFQLFQQHETRRAMLMAAVDRLMQSNVPPFDQQLDSQQQMMMLGSTASENRAGVTSEPVPMPAAASSASLAHQLRMPPQAAGLTPSRIPAAVPCVSSVSVEGSPLPVGAAAGGSHAQLQGGLTNSPFSAAPAATASTAPRTSVIASSADGVSAVRPQPASVREDGSDCESGVTIGQMVLDAAAELSRSTNHES